MTYLNLEECQIENDETLQEIFKNLTQLKYFHIIQFSKCDISDYGFTGQSETEHIGHTISNLKNLESLYVRINFSNLGDLTLSHISKLKQLKTLNIYCKNVISCEFYPTFLYFKLIQFFFQASKTANKNLKESCPFLKHVFIADNCYHSVLRYVPKKSQIPSNMYDLNM